MEGEIVQRERQTQEQAEKGTESDKIKSWSMEEGDGGITDMTGRGRRGDKRCGSSILRVSSVWRGCCSM